ncbi:MAG: TraB/GumN family protein, partial [Candidatus Adiutrix sp.]
GFADLFFKEYDKYPEMAPLFEQLIERRNENMLSAIHALMSPDFKGFIVVGAGHVVGPMGLVNKLSEMGYALKQL